MKEYFAIIGQTAFDHTIYRMLGTGCFIDNKGTFITAGHIFRDHRHSMNQFFICFPEREENVELSIISNYKFISRKLYSDEERRQNSPRLRKEYQCGPEYTDVAVGIVMLENTPYFILQKKRPFERDKLLMPCYNINLQTCPDRRINSRDGLINCSYIEFHNRNLELRERLRRARIPFLYEDMEFDNIDTYNNCIEVYGEGKKGNSGAPVLNEKNQVIGIYITGANFINLRAVHLSRYLMKKARKLLKLL